MNKFKKLDGMIAATFTPMTGAGEINYPMIDTYADYVATTPINGVFVCGTTGEFSSLTMSERKSILECWIKASRGRFRIIAHVGSNCQKDSVELAAHAASVSADAVGSIAPSFFKPGSVDNLIAYFTPIAAAAPALPFYYYNMPAMTGVNLPVDKFLLEGRKVIPNLAGTKFTHNNLMEMGACIALDKGAFEVLHGYDEVLIAGLALGAVAGIGSTYNYIPEIYNGIFEAMKVNDVAGARRLQSISIAVVDVIIRYGGGVRAGKAVMKHIGVDCGDCRLPIAPFTPEEDKNLLQELQVAGFPKFKDKK